MSQRVRSSLLLLAATTILPIAAWAALAPHAARAHVIAFSDFIPRSDRLFVSPGLTGRKLEDVDDRLSEATNRVRSLFGAVRANPTVIIAADEESALRYSTNLHASTHVSPFGTAYVVLGPEGKRPVLGARFQRGRPDHELRGLEGSSRRVLARAASSPLSALSRRAELSSTVSFSARKGTRTLMPTYRAPSPRDSLRISEGALSEANTSLLSVTRIALQEFLESVERLLREPFEGIVFRDDLESVFVFS